MTKKEGKLGPKTISAYRTTIKYCRTAISDLNLNLLPIEDVKRVHVKSIIERMQKNYKLTAKGYNKHLGHLHIILSELIQWDIIDRNPADDIKRQPVMVTRANIPPTPSQEKEI